MGRPADNDVFAAYRRMFDYERSALNAAVDSVDDTHPVWRDEAISFDAAYGGERMIAHLLVPKHATPPYQTIIFYPGDGAFGTDWDYPFTTYYVEFIVESGRAVYPFYKGMHARRTNGWEGDVQYRDRVIEWARDLSRSIDYLETREDIDSERLAFFGFSRGGTLGPVFTAVESRFAASILLTGGFANNEYRPEIHPLHFSPRSTVPTLMLYGLYDPVRVPARLRDADLRAGVHHRRPCRRGRFRTYRPSRPVARTSTSAPNNSLSGRSSTRWRRESVLSKEATATETLTAILRTLRWRRRS